MLINSPFHSCYVDRFSKWIKDLGDAKAPMSGHAVPKLESIGLIGRLTP